MSRMKTRELTVETGSEPDPCRSDGRLRRASSPRRAAEDGLLTVFVPHATAGVVVVELGAGSDADLLAALGAPAAAR